MRPAAIRKRTTRKTVSRRPPTIEDDVERDSNDSFPASDPPSWIPVARVGEPSHDRRSPELQAPAD